MGVWANEVLWVARKEQDKVILSKIQETAIQRQIQKEAEKKRREEERIAAEKLAAKKAKKQKENPDSVEQEGGQT